MCQANLIVLQARHIPGRLNVLADILLRPSRMSGTEWSLHTSVFRALTQEWGIQLLGPFATRWNHKLPLFVSPVPDPSAMAVHALSMSWNASTTSSVTTGAREGPTRSDPHCPKLVPGDLVPTTLRDVGTISTLDTQHSSVTIPALRSDPSRYVQSPASCVEGIRDTLCSRDLSVDVASRVSRPQRESTLASMSPPSGGSSLLGVTYHTLIHSRLL